MPVSRMKVFVVGRMGLESPPKAKTLLKRQEGFVEKAD